MSLTPAATAPALRARVEEMPKETCFQKTIRNPLVYGTTRSCQAVALLAGLVASVAGFYFASLQGANAPYALALGCAGLVILTHSGCSLSMMVDYKVVLDQSRKVYSLELAKERLEEQVAALDRMERGISKEGDEVHAQVELLKAQVTAFQEQIGRYESCLRELGATQTQLTELRTALHEEQKGLAAGVTQLTHAAAAASYIHDSAQRSRLEAIGAIEMIERRISAKERELLSAVSSAERDRRLTEVLEALETFKRESLHDYEALVARFAKLAV